MIYTRGPFDQQGFTLISAWISDYIHLKVRDENTYRLENFQGAADEVCEWIISSHIFLGMWLLIHVGNTVNPY